MPSRVTIRETLVGRALISVVEGHYIYRVTCIQNFTFRSPVAETLVEWSPLSQVVVPAFLLGKFSRSLCLCLLVFSLLP